MRRPAVLATLLLALAGCETQPLGGRCESNLDCDRNTSATATSQCVSFARPGVLCSATGGLDCICCPVDPAARASVTSNGVQICVGSSTDAAPTDASDSAVDTGADTGTTDASDAGADAVEAGACTMSCAAGTFCQDGVCRPSLNIGQTCTGDTQCATTHCVTGVCCNSACTCAGCSCAISPDFAGLCMRAPTDAGATD